ncbi:hypothetical protein [Candidatus Avelusimicrobium caledoniensis]|uniref:hypothetical protein n=1 Tax=Candidatus Avelusimicrobium caledoniensis TaxID=3416220 RepID=UPI003D12704F
MNLYQGCALTAVVAFVVLVIFAIRTLIQILHTAQAMEYLAVSAAEKVDKTQSTFTLLDNVSTFLNSGVFKVAKISLDVVRHLRKEK